MFHTSHFYTAWKYYISPQDFTISSFGLIHFQRWNFRVNQIVSSPADWSPADCFPSSSHAPSGSAYAPSSSRFAAAVKIPSRLNADPWQKTIWGFGGAWVLKQLCCVWIRRRDLIFVKHDNELTFNKLVIIILFSASKLPSVPLKCAPVKQQINSASTFAVNESSWIQLVL